MCSFIQTRHKVYSVTQLHLTILSSSLSLHKWNAILKVYSEVKATLYTYFIATHTSAKNCSTWILFSALAVSQRWSLREKTGSVRSAYVQYACEFVLHDIAQMNISFHTFHLLLWPETLETAWVSSDLPVQVSAKSHQDCQCQAMSWQEHGFGSAMLVCIRISLCIYIIWLWRHHRI